MSLKTFLAVTGLNLANSNTTQLRRRSRIMLAGVRVLLKKMS